MTFWKLLTPEEWNAVSACGTAASAVIAFLGLGFIGLQLKAAKKTADVQTLQEFLRATTEREQALIKNETPEAKEQAFYEFANFLELQAAALHGHLFAKVTTEIVREKIVDSLAFIESADPWMDKLLVAKSSATVFKHLLRFSKRNRRKIDAVKKTQKDTMPSITP